MGAMPRVGPILFFQSTTDSGKPTSSSSCTKGIKSLFSRIVRQVRNDVIHALDIASLVLIYTAYSHMVDSPLMRFGSHTILPACYSIFKGSDKKLVEN
ncbi:hypothetical protein SAMN05216404_10464 [Nitrosospira multiformis]|uniref:Uncharacterized protein n=1 Tax=Nitrosospira multiformis TaxID=1231 RepID=A0A1H8G1H5_9PROT|nr:hypothetical protein SAMN05216404_10464 [Nitrosospira multiformis]